MIFIIYSRCSSAFFEEERSALKTETAENKALTTKESCRCFTIQRSPRRFLCPWLLEPKLLVGKDKLITILTCGFSPR